MEKFVERNLFNERKVWVVFSKIKYINIKNNIELWYLTWRKLKWICLTRWRLLFRNMMFYSDKADCPCFIDAKLTQSWIMVDFFSIDVHNVQYYFPQFVQLFLSLSQDMLTFTVLVKVCYDKYYQKLEGSNPKSVKSRRLTTPHSSWAYCTIVNDWKVELNMSFRETKRFIDHLCKSTILFNLLKCIFLFKGFMCLRLHKIRL